MKNILNTRENMQNTFLIALARDDAEQARLLLTQGADIISNIQEVDSPLRTALVMNPNTNDWNCVVLLLDKNVDPSICVKNGSRISPLHLMARGITPARLHVLQAIVRYEDRNQVELMQYLKDASQRTPFDYLSPSHQSVYLEQQRIIKEETALDKSTDGIIAKILSLWRFPFYQQIRPSSQQMETDLKSLSCNTVSEKKSI